MVKSPRKSNAQPVQIQTSYSMLRQSILQDGTIANRGIRTSTNSFLFFFFRNELEKQKQLEALRIEEAK